MLSMVDPWHEPPATSGDGPPAKSSPHNLTRARDLRGVTQTEVAERLSRFTGTKWSQATVA